MECGQCKADNDENAKFCKKCGNSLTIVNQVNQPKNKSDSAILIYLAWCIFHSLVVNFAASTRIDFIQGSVYYIMAATGIITGIFLVFLGISVKNSQMRILAVVLAAIIWVYNIFQSIQIIKNLP